MAILTWPEALRPSNMEWKLTSNSKEFTSPFTGASQVVSWPGSRWSMSLKFENLDDWESRKLEVLIAKLDGMAGMIKVGDFGRWGRPPFGRPVVKGSNNTGTELPTRGWDASRLVLKEGDYITVNDELKLVTEDVWSDAQGLATIKISPLLREMPPDGATIETQNPYGIFRLSSNENSVTRAPAFNNTINLEFKETF
ncbi:hypothetical protein BRET_17 [Escherichia phage BRET]|nr:hypothetical protein BRET_17 [Escherichia phage BRET]